MIARLNVEHLSESQSAVLDNSVNQLVLTGDDAIYVPIATFLVSLLAFATLAETYNGGTSKPWADDDDIVLDAPSAGIRLSVLGLPIAAAAVKNCWPVNISFNLIAQPMRPHGGNNHLGQIGPYIFSAMQGMFTAFYEEHVGIIKTVHGPVASWPAVWNFGRIVRNALSHGGDLDIRQPTAVSWRNLHYNEDNHGQRVILTDLWPGDLFLLLKDMQDTLPAPS